MNISALAGDVVVAAGRLVEVLAEPAPPVPEALEAVFAGHPHMVSSIPALSLFWKRTCWTGAPATARLRANTIRWGVPSRG
ncbi:hypothetical protein [Falsirhodobacter deserti]|uniref:hypothetical protein n=1 Tax=Falsirhodobacter deserti TaxID=1365611 RepID=UPI0013E40232|nr:hypothetical protein [Falsirhodobacter deserti]